MQSQQTHFPKAITLKLKNTISLKLYTQVVSRSISILFDNAQFNVYISSFVWLNKNEANHNPILL